MRKLLLLIPLAVLLVACNGTPTVIPTVTPDAVGARETRVAHIEQQLGALLVVLKGVK